VHIKRQVRVSAFQLAISDFLIYLVRQKPAHNSSKAIQTKSMDGNTKGSIWTANSAIIRKEMPFHTATLDLV
jgi:hypothetical protein